MAGAAAAQDAPPPAAAVSVLPAPLHEAQRTPLDGDLLKTILVNLVDARCVDLRAALCVCTNWKAVAKAEVLWELACQKSFHVSRRVRPLRVGAPGVEACECFHSAWLDWEALRVALRLGPGELDGALWMRVQEVWSRLEAWYLGHHQPIAETLGRGASPEEWSAYLRRVCGAELWEDVARRPACRALQLVYSRHNGQDLDLRVTASSRGYEDVFKGMFGGYSAYDHFVCSSFCSLQRAATLAAGLHRLHIVPRDHLVLAGDFQGMKFLVLDTSTGSLLLVTRNGRAPAAPPLGTETLLCWLETFAARLEGDMYRAERLIPDMPDSTGLNLFPLNGPEVSCVVTRGIRVTASPIHMPEHAQGWTYSIRIRLLTPGEDGYMTAEERGFTTAQLRSRHWEIRDGHGEVSHVRGFGVIGKYPLLFEGGWRDDEDNGAGAVMEGDRRAGEFTYQSCSGRTTGPQEASFGGELLFVPGSLQEPQGQEFEVIVGRFPLRVPEWII